MGTSGIRRKVDDLGRVVIPSSIRKILGIAEGDLLEITLEGDRVVLTLPNDSCTFCGSSLHLDVFRGKVVCWSCTAALRAMDRARERAEPA
jgi:transcriptional pleiotropic regulator of transition state genes